MGFEDLTELEILQSSLALVFVIISLILATAMITMPCYAENNCLRKLGRGVANVATGFLEVPRNVVDVTKYEGPIAGATYGFFKGCRLVEPINCPCRNCS